MLAAETLTPALAALSGSVTSAGAADPGVTVSLLNASAAVVTTTVTTATGGYQFTGIAPGSYEVEFARGANQAFAGGPANGTTGITPLMTLAAGQSLTVAAEDLEAATASIAGTVTYAGAMEAGAGVSLLSAAGATLASTVTSASGAYQFTGLAAGAYAVKFASTGAQIFASGPASTATGITPSQSLATGQALALAAEDLEPAPATLSGTLTYAGAADPGVAVTLLSTAGAALATTVTSASGTYQFTSLASGAYAVKFASTAAQIFSSGPASSATGITPAQTLAAGQTLTLATEDLEPASATLAGALTDAGAADPGVTVTLLSAGRGDARQRHDQRCGCLPVYRPHAGRLRGQVRQHGGANLLLRPGQQRHGDHTLANPRCRPNPDARDRGFGGRPRHLGRRAHLCRRSRSRRHRHPAQRHRHHARNRGHQHLGRLPIHRPYRRRLRGQVHQHQRANLCPLARPAAPRGSHPRRPSPQARP